VRNEEDLLFIIESKGTWWAMNGGRQLGPYETSQLALDAIVWAVTNFPDPDVLVSAVGRDADGKTRMLWRQESRGGDIEAD
jgi:hypothetical protein